jgi:hypothetical protein
MGQRKLSEEKLREIRELAAGWGKIVARRVEGDNISETGLDLQAMEQIAQAATAGLTEGVFEALLQRQTQSLGTEQPCPDCGRPCPVGSEDRPLFVKGGKINFHEPVCYCSACRRDFFPPEGLSASG